MRVLSCEVTRKMKITIVLILLTVLSGCSSRYALTEVKGNKEPYVFNSGRQETQCFIYTSSKQLKELSSCLESTQQNNSNFHVVLSKQRSVTDVSPGMVVFLGLIPSENYHFYKVKISPPKKGKAPYYMYFTITESWSSVNTFTNVLSTSKSLSELETEILTVIQQRVDSANE